MDRELGQQWFAFWSSASDWKERYDEQCKEIKAKNKCSSRQPTYNRFTDVPLTRGWWREQEKLQTRQKREKKQDEEDEEDVDCTCYEDAFGWCKVCKPKEEEEEQEEEEREEEEVIARRAAVEGLFDVAWDDLDEDARANLYYYAVDHGYIEQVKKRHVMFDEEFDEEYEKFDKKWQEEHWK